MWPGNNDSEDLVLATIGIHTVTSHVHGPNQQCMHSVFITTAIMLLPVSDHSIGILGPYRLHHHAASQSKVDLIIG